MVKVRVNIIDYAVNNIKSKGDEGSPCFRPLFKLKHSEYDKLYLTHDLM